jgi:hypothetical protein
MSTEIEQNINRSHRKVSICSAYLCFLSQNKLLKSYENKISLRLFYFDRINKKESSLEKSLIRRTDLQKFKKLVKEKLIIERKKKFIFLNDQKLFTKELKGRNTLRDYQLIGFEQYIIKSNKEFEFNPNVIEFKTLKRIKQETRKFLWATVLLSMPKETSLETMSRWLNVSKSTIINNAIKKNLFIKREKRELVLFEIARASKDDANYEAKKGHIKQRLKEITHKIKDKKENQSKCIIRLNRGKTKYLICAQLTNKYKAKKKFIDNLIFAEDSLRFQKKNRRTFLKFNSTVDPQGDKSETKINRKQNKFWDKILYRVEEVEIKINKMTFTNLQMFKNELNENEIGLINELGEDVRQRNLRIRKPH